MDPITAFERREDVVFLDVREPYEWTAGRIDGANHIPLEQLPARLGEIGRESALVVVCRSGTRSDHAAAFLRARGFDAHNLDGGLRSWRRRGLPLIGDFGEGRIV